MKRIITLLLAVVFYTSHAQSTKGNLAGKIIDRATNEEIIGATVAIEGTSTGATTDLDGKFFLKLDPGTYTIVVSYVSYKTKKYEGIEIKSGELTPLNVSLDENSTELEEVVVQGEARKESAAGLLLQQKNAVSMSSGISAELIRKMPDRTTADVIKRVSGASIQDGKFAVIRGLQDRYNYGMINGAPLPSSETDKKAFSLDIVPAQVVDNMVISKTATPDMPGDFAGGIIQINTREIPDENIRFINIGGGYNTLTTFKDFNKSPQASGTDWLGFDNGPRQLPSIIASTNSIQNTELAIHTNDSQINQQTNSFNNNFVPFKSSALPNISFQAGLSQRLRLFKNDLGVIAAITYNNTNKNTPTSGYSNPVVPKDATEFDKTAPAYYSPEYISSKNSVNLGGILNFSYKIGQNVKISFKNLLTQNADNMSFTRHLDNINLNYDPTTGLSQTTKNLQYSNYYNSNRMYSSQLGFEKYFEQSKIKLKGTFGYNNLYRDVPDFKFMTYTTGQINATDPQIYTLQINNGAHSAISSGLLTPGRFFSTLNEHSYSGNLEGSMPFFLAFKNEIKVGGMYQDRERDYQSRVFSMRLENANALNPNVLNSDSTSPSNIFNTANIGSPSKFYTYENTRNFNNYTAGSTLYAGFIMFESKIKSNLRAIYGLRVEDFNQRLTSKDAKDQPVNLNVTWIDPLPSVNIIYSLTEKMNLRGSYARTVSRPEFREFAPLQYFDITTNNLIFGNSSLTRAQIHNFDVKYEIYPGAGSIFSVNPFLKQFSNPIELTLVPQGQEVIAYTYNNAKAATNYGVEFELRINPNLFSKSIGKEWENLVLFSNFTYIYSKVDLSNIQAGASNVQSRPMQGQSPYVFNGGIQYSTDKSGWDFTLSGNQVGRRIYAVSNQRNQIIWENPRFVLDASISKSFLKEKLKIRAIMGDLLAQNLIFYMDVDQNGSYNEDKDVTMFKYRNGQTISFQAIYNF